MDLFFWTHLVPREIVFQALARPIITAVATAHATPKILPRTCLTCGGEEAAEVDLLRCHDTEKGEGQLPS